MAAVYSSPLLDFYLTKYHEEESIVVAAIFIPLMLYVLFSLSSTFFLVIVVFIVFVKVRLSLWSVDADDAMLVR